MSEPNPPSEDPAPKPPTPMTDWMAVWAEEEARDQARQEPEAGSPEADTHVLTPEQIWGATPDLLLPAAKEPEKPAAARDPMAPTTAFEGPRKEDFDGSLDGEIRQLLERTARYVKRPEVSQPEGVSPPPGGGKQSLDFDTPPGAWSAMTPAPLAFDEAASFRDETGGRLGLFEPVERQWEDPPTPHGGAIRRKPSRPPMAPFENPSMTAPLPDPSAQKKKPSGPPRVGGENLVAPIPWTDAPPLSQAAVDRSTTRRMKDTAKRVRQSLAPIAAAAVAEPAAPWLTLGIAGVAAAWISIGFAAGRVSFVVIGLAFLAPIALFTALGWSRRG